MQLWSAHLVLSLVIFCPTPGRSEFLTNDASTPTQKLAAVTQRPVQYGPSYKYLPSDNSTGCKVMLIKTHSTLYFYSDSCREMPRVYNYDVQKVSIKSTKIVAINRNEFLGWDAVTSLAIETNPELSNISEGVFSRFSQLIHLTISNNYKLTSLPKNAFEGLTNLRHLVLRKNGFHHLKMVTALARPSILPHLVVLDASENAFITVQKDDVENLNGSSIQEFLLNLCSLVNIESDSLRVLTHLRSLSLGGNNLDTKNITELIRNLSSVAPNFKRLNIAGNMLQTDSIELFRPVSETNISYLNLRETHFTYLNVSELPIMPKLEHLDLSGIKAIGAPTEVFSQRIFPKLKSLNLAKDNYLGTVFKFELPNLKILDLSSYSCEKLCETSHQFKMDDFYLKGLTSLETLLLNNNALYVLTSGKFDGLTNLTKLVLRSCSIYRIYQSAFSELNKLKTLDLAYNSFSDTASLVKGSFHGLSNLRVLDLESCDINFVTPGLFEHLIQLESLNLRYNGIGHLEPTFFVHQQQLRAIDLTYNSVHKWEKRVFKNNTRLESVILSNNLIEELTASMVKDFKGVSYLNLYGNPLACTCTEVRIVASQELEAVFHILENERSNTNPAYCSSPISMINVSYSVFILNALDKETCELEKINMVLIVVAVVVPLVLLLLSIVGYILRWHLKYWLFLLRQLIRCYYFPKNKNRKSGGQYRYDAFVSYSQEDRSFVVKLVSMLESQEPFLSLCVFERDFVAGGAITDSVFECLAQSRRTILILSKAFAQSRWCQWELQLAQNKKLVFKDETDDPLIIIKVGDIDESYMTPSLRYLTKTRIYLQWNSDPIKQKLFWRRLRDALARPEGVIEGRYNQGFVL